MKEGEVFCMRKLFLNIFLWTLLVVLVSAMGGCGGSTNNDDSNSLTISPVTPTIGVGDTVQFVVKSSNVDVTSSAAWETSTSCLTMNYNGTAGLALATCAGTVKVTALYGGDSAIATVTIAGSTTLTTIEISSSTATIPVGGTTQFTATGHYSDTGTQDLTNYVAWASDNEAVATISSTGLATGVSVGNANITASFAGITSNTAVLTVGGSSVGINNPISTDINSPSVVSLATAMTFSIPGNTLNGYVDFHTSDGLAYGIYVTNATGTLTLESGYNSSGTWVPSGVGTVNPVATNDLVNGFKAGTADHMAMISNSTGSAITFDITVHEAPMGAPSFGTPLPISLGTPRWIGAAFDAGDFSFVAGGATATLQFDNLTAGVDVAVFEVDETTVVLPETSDGTETQLTKTVNVTGLTSSNTYVIRVTSHVNGTNGASVGQLTITSP